MDDFEMCYRLGVESLEARCLPSVSGWWQPSGLYPDLPGVVTAAASNVGSHTLTPATGNALTAGQAVSLFDSDDEDDDGGVDGPEPANLLPNRSVPINPTQERGDPDDDGGPPTESAQLPALTLAQNQADSGVGLVPLHGVTPTSPVSIAGLTVEIVSGTVGGSNQSELAGFVPAIAAHAKTLEGLVLDISWNLSVELSRPPIHDRAGGWNPHFPELIDLNGSFQDGTLSECLRQLRNRSNDLFDLQTDVGDFIDNPTTLTPDDAGPPSEHGSVWLTAAVFLAVGVGVRGATGLLQRQVKTTTWPSRHDDTLTRFVDCLSSMNVNNLTVLEVGPGAATKFLAPYYPAPDKGETLPWLATRWRFLIRRFDSLLRRIPGIELCSFEPGELQCLLPAYVNHHVADISLEVIAAIQEQYLRVNARVHDFSRSPYPESLDAIICLCVLVRAKKPKMLFKHLYKSLKPGGLLVMDNRSVRSFGGPEYPLQSISNQLFRKPVNSKS